MEARFPDASGKLSGGLHICWSKKNPESKPLLKDFDEGMKLLKSSGKYGKIRKNSVSISDQTKFFLIC